MTAMHKTAVGLVILTALGGAYIVYSQWRVAHDAAETARYAAEAEKIEAKLNDALTGRVFTENELAEQMQACVLEQEARGIAHYNELDRLGYETLEEKLAYVEDNPFSADLQGGPECQRWSHETERRRIRMNPGSRHFWENQLAVFRAH